MDIIYFALGCCLGVVVHRLWLLIRANQVRVYDQCETIENCTVEILTDSKTGECSVAWWRGTVADEPKVRE